jgi:hypothetical protein
MQNRMRDLLLRQRTQTITFGGAGCYGGAEARGAQGITGNRCRRKNR